MSKQYKLLKLYPSLPSHWKVGDIVEKETCKEELVSVSVYRNINRMSCGHCLINEVENNPEFWEKVVEKDYEILSFKDKCNERFIKIYKTGTHQFKSQSTGCPFTEKELLESCNIHSVKRLSDGEVFTVGDRIKFKDSGFIKKIFEICYSKYNKADDNNLYLYTKEGYNVSIQNGEHIKQPLFTTDDGVDIYKGDTYYFVSPQDHWHIRKMSDSKNTKGNYGRAYFKSKQKAREWVDQNKPLYSKKDIENAIDYSNFNGVFERFANINLKSFWEKLNDN